MNNRIPAFQFYPADWRKDIAVQSLSFHDRGVWHEILCLMHESEQRGKLLLNGQPMPTEVLARILGLDKQSLEQTLEKLLSYGVASRDERGVLFNRRMVKDETERQSNADRQRKFYHKNKPNAEPNGNLTENKRKSNSPSSSSSSSSEKNKPNGLSKSACVSETADPEESEFTEKVIDGIKKRLRVTFSLPDENGWYQSAVWAYVNGYTPEQFLACYDHLKSQTWREGRVTAKNVEGNLPDYALDAETATAEYINPLTGRGLK